MKQRLITAAVLILIAVPPLVYGGMLLNVLMGVVALLGTYEYVKCVTDDKKELYLFTAILFLVTMVSIYLRAYDFSLSALLIVLLFALNVNVEKYDLSKISFLFLMYRLLTTGLECFVSVRSHGFAETLFVLLLCYLADSFALLGGMKFGKHKLNERISPKKTVEGFFCGYLVGALGGLICGLFFTSYSKLLVITASLTIPLISQLGDLAFSSVKRYYGIKDFSNIFPGHGGMLDRIDSLIFALVAMNILLGVL